MIATIKKLLGIKITDYNQLMAEGAIIIDVRTAKEYKYGNIDGSINIPVDKLSASVSKLKAKRKPIITCCASGSRSASAKMILERAGIENVYNGGSWNSLYHKLN